MMKNDAENPKLKAALQDLQAMPDRSHQAFENGKYNFMQSARKVRSESLSAGMNRNRGNKRAFMLFPVSRKALAFNPVLVIVLVLLFLFGGTGLTVGAAQGSLPGENLYPVKIWGEDMVIVTAYSPEKQINYYLVFSDRRVQELASLLDMKKAVPESLVNRQRDQLNEALKLATSMDDSEMVAQLLQIQLHAEDQLAAVNRLMDGSENTAQPVLLQVRAQIEEQLRLSRFGGADPEEYRLQMQSGKAVPTSAPTQTMTATNPQSIPNNSITPFKTDNGNGNGSPQIPSQGTQSPGQMGPATQSPGQGPSGSGHGRTP